MDKITLLFTSKKFKIEHNGKYDRFVITSTGDDHWVSMNETSFRMFLTMVVFGKPFEKVDVKQNSSEVLIAKYPSGIKIDFTGRNSASNIYVPKDTVTTIADQITDLRNKFELVCAESEKNKSWKNLEEKGDGPTTSTPVKRKFDVTCNENKEEDGCVRKKPRRGHEPYYNTNNELCENSQDSGYFSGRVNPSKKIDDDDDNETLTFSQFF